MVTIIKQKTAAFVKHKRDHGEYVTNRRDWLAYLALLITDSRSVFLKTNLKAQNLMH